MLAALPVPRTEQARGGDYIGNTINGWLLYVLLFTAISGVLMCIVLQAGPLGSLAVGCWQRPEAEVTVMERPTEGTSVALGRFASQSCSSNRTRSRRWPRL